MTVANQRFCHHCGQPYTFYAAGGGWNRLSSKDHCETCNTTLHETLKTMWRAIPIHVVRVWAPTQAVDLGTLLRWQQEWLKNGGMKIERVSFPLFRVGTGESSNQAYVVGLDDFQERYFHYRFWPGKEAEAEITEELGLHLETGDYRFLVPYLSGQPNPSKAPPELLEHHRNAEAQRRIVPVPKQP